ncbi:MAG: hypothetical protein IIW80_03165 [Treponema sp.]|nr:hypothetical protein [Treponema sp.]
MNAGASIFNGSSILGWFLDRVCTHILAFENNSEVRYFEGNWSEYAEWKKEQFGEDASVPKRVQYRKLSR